MTTTRTALVVYESMFGNTRAVAEAIAEGLRAPDLAVEVRDAASGPEPRGYELIVAGGPTHAFSLSRRSTREDAARQGAHGETDTGLREWLETLPHANGSRPLFATFDTKLRHAPGSAARKAARLAHTQGYAVIRRESFYVLGTPGPLADTELERARTWGSRLGSSLLQREQAS